MLNILLAVFGAAGLVIGIVSVSEVSSDKKMRRILTDEISNLEDKLILRNNLLEDKSKELSNFKQKYNELETVSDFRQMTIAKLVDTNCKLAIESDYFEKDNIRLQTLVDNLKNEIGYQSNMLEKRDDTIDDLIRKNIDKDKVIDNFNKDKSNLLKLDEKEIKTSRNIKKAISY